MFFFSDKLLGVMLSAGIVIEFAWRDQHLEAFGMELSAGRFSAGRLIIEFSFNFLPSSLDKGFIRDTVKSSFIVINHPLEAQNRLFGNAI